MEERYYATGRRKTSIARVWLTQGSGKVMVNSMVPVGLLSAADNFTEMNIQQIMPSGSNCVAVTAAKA